MTTYQDYINCTREELLVQLQKQVSPKRYQHSLGVEEAAIALAKRYGYDEIKAGLAGLLHDYAKELEQAEFEDLIERYHLSDDLKRWNANILHGLVGIYKIQEDLQLQDAAILQAIQYHTVGSHQMTWLDKIVYVADYIEKNRHFDGVEEARQLAKESLDKAVAYETAHTVAFLAQKKVPIYPQTLETYNRYIDYLK